MKLVFDYLCKKLHLMKLNYLTMLMLLQSIEKMRQLTVCVHPYGLQQKNKTGLKLSKDKLFTDLLNMNNYDMIKYLFKS